MIVDVVIQGCVDFFSASRGYGFLTAPDRKRYWFHQSYVLEGLRLYENDVVSFRLRPGKIEGKPEAFDIKLMTPAPSTKVGAL